MKFFNLLNKETAIKIQKFITIGFLSFSIWFSILSIIAVGLVWYHAFQDGMIPENWGTYEGNHGPWRHYYPGRTLIYYTIIFQLKSFFCALISLFFKRTRLGVWLAIISFLIFIIIFSSHYWLID